MNKILSDFVKLIKNGNVELYNEFSFQHELGIFLRNRLKDKKVQFERNVSYFDFNKAQFEKKEIDICIFSERSMDCVIELKYPRNGQVPETMYGFCKDIMFLEQLVGAGFKSAYFIAIVDDPLFYSGNLKGIYGLFRGGEKITGLIRKPTGAKNTQVNIDGSYTATWRNLNNKSKVCIIEICHQT